MNAGPTHRLAWDGVSFLLPANWDLSEYTFQKNLTSIKVEDEFSVRLEAEWMRHKGSLDYGKVRRRFDKTAQKLTKRAKAVKEIRRLPSQWTAFRYNIDSDRLMLGFFLAADSSFFFLVRIYFDAQATENAQDILRLIVDSFQLHAGETIPWSMYDMQIELPSDFRLASTSLETGRKLLVFQWRLRRLLVWWVSFASIALKDSALEEWVAAFLNKSKKVKGLRFFPGSDGQVQSKRKALRHPFRHSEEIARMCFRYQARCLHDERKNQIRFYVYQYRKEEDLRRLPEDILPRG